MSHQKSATTAPGEPARRRVICLGNDISGDDGVGLVVGRELGGLTLPPGVEVELAGRLELEFLDTLCADEGLLLVDAAQMGEPPGTVRLLDIASPGLSGGEPSALAHGLSAGRLLQLGRRLRPGSMPRRLELLGIQPARLDCFDEALSPEVAAAVPEAVERCLRWVDVTGDRD